jgi:hypothetical protein
MNTMENRMLMVCPKCSRFWVILPQGFKNVLYCSNCGGALKEE